MAFVGLVLILFFLLAVALLASVHNGGGDINTDARTSLRRVDRQLDQQVARDLADTGVRMAIQWLVEQPSAPVSDRAFAPGSVGSAFYGATTVDGWAQLSLAQGPTSGENAAVLQRDGTIRVRFLPSAQSPRTYAIECTGLFRNARCTNRVHIRPKSLAYYGVFYDEAIDGYFIAGYDHYDGPVHFNWTNSSGTLDTSRKLHFIWDTSPRIFDWANADYMTFTGGMDLIDFNKMGTANRPPTDAEWPQFALAGRAPLVNQAILPFPATTDVQRGAALGTASEPTGVGVTLPSNGAETTAGILVRGDVKTLVLKTAGGDNTTQIAEIVQRDGTNDLKSIVTIDRQAMTTRLQVSTAPAGTGTYTAASDVTYQGITNGLLYVDGNIGDPGTRTGGLSGLVANNVVSGSVISRWSNLTIATPSTRTIVVNGGVVYQPLQTGGDANNWTSRATAANVDVRCGMLGVVCGTLQHGLTDNAGRTITELSEHFVRCALVKEETPAYNSRPVGNRRVVGGVIVKQTNYDGTYNSRTMAMATGFMVATSFDVRAQENPPPFFPSSSKDYQLLSYTADVEAIP